MSEHQLLPNDCLGLIAANSDFSTTVSLASTSKTLRALITSARNMFVNVYVPHTKTAPYSRVFRLHKEPLLNMLQTKGVTYFPVSKFVNCEFVAGLIAVRNNAIYQLLRPDDVTSNQFGQLFLLLWSPKSNEVILDLFLYGTNLHALATQDKILTLAEVDLDTGLSCGIRVAELCGRSKLAVLNGVFALGPTGLKSLLDDRLINNDNILCCTQFEDSIYYSTRDAVKVFHTRDSKVVTLIQANHSSYHSILYREMGPFSKGTSLFKGKTRFLIAISKKKLVVYHEQPTIGFTVRWCESATPGSAFSALDERFFSLLVCQVNAGNTLLCCYDKWFSQRSKRLSSRLITGGEATSVNIGSGGVSLFYEDDEQVRTFYFM